MFQTLSFSNEVNKRWDTVEDGKRIAAKILATSKIHTLEFSGNTLGIQASAPIAEVLKKHPELKVAQWKDIFTTRLNTEIPVVLKSFTDAMIFAGTRLTTLDLSDNAIGPQAIHGLQGFLSSEACFGLKNLYLNNCGLGSAGINVAKCLIECHRNAIKAGKFFELEVFVAGRNRLENPGAKALAEAFSTLKSLVEVRMYQNGIKEAGIMELAKALGKNPKLRIIDLNDNTFNETAATSMAKVVGKLNDIVCIDFTDCLCRAKGCLNIVHELVKANSCVQELLLGGNEIDADTMQQITQLSRQLPKLKKLSLSANNLGSKYSTLKRDFANSIIDLGNESDDQGSLSGSEDENIEDESSEEENVSADDWDDDKKFMTSFTDADFVAALQGLSLLEPQKQLEPCTLSFSNEVNKRWDTVEDGKRIAAKILSTTKIHTLEFSGNTLGIKASAPIAEVLKKHPELKVAQWKDIFTTRLNTEIPVVLKSFTDAMIFAGTRLTTLDLSDNAIGPQAIHGIQGFLSSEACFGLKNLYLNNCGLGSAGINVAKCLIDCHQNAIKAGKFFELEVFVAGRNRLENPGAKALAEAFSTLKSLVEVRMYQNGIKEAGIMELAKALGKNPKLRIIDLNDNTFNEPAATSMAKVVGKLNDIMCIDFTDCLCRSKGCLNIVHELVKANSCVQELFLGGNEIDVNTMQQITQLSRQLPKLKKLNLSANNLGSKFSTLKRDFASPIIDLGNESDDQGSLSGSESDA